MKDMEKFRFNPRELLSQIVQIMLRVTAEEQAGNTQFVNSLASHPDYNSDVMKKACDILVSKNILDERTVTEFEALNEGVSHLCTFVLVSCYQYSAASTVQCCRVCFALCVFRKRNVNRAIFVM